MTLIAKLRYRRRPAELGAPPEDKTMLGIHAERLLKDPVLHLAFDRVADRLHATWLASDAGDDAGRERVYMQRKALDRVRQELMAFLGDKQMVEAEQKAKDARDQRERDRRTA